MVLIRPALPEDAGSVRHVVSDAGLPVAGLDQAWTTLVAEDAHEIVGVAALERHGFPAAQVRWVGPWGLNPQPAD